MVVMKFGGTSVASLSMIDRALSIVWGRVDEAPVLVSSAMGKTTDALVSLTEQAAQGDRKLVGDLVSELESRHLEAVSVFSDSEIRERTATATKELVDQLRSLLTGVTLIQECSPRTQDAVLSFGERLATTIIEGRALDRGMNAKLLDSRHLITTDDQFGAANVLFPDTYDRIHASVKPQAGQITILQGFIAHTLQGVTSTLGRGGSDYTASIVAAGLGADSCEIWTDVDGIMTMDPRLVADARTVPQMSYDEAAELAFFGARVVHPSTIQPAIEHGVRVFVRNTNKPDEPGTEISSEAGSKGVRALASKAPTSVITIHSSRMLNAYGFLSRIFSVFERHRISVDVVATSEVSVSVTIDDPPDLGELIADLSAFARVEREDNQGILCLVGTDLWKDSRTVARAFGALRELPIRLISLGSSDVNLTVVLPADAIGDAARALHSEFF
ncbi:MAG: aspartate kinase, partial [Spirochaetales bacterium]